MKTFCGKSLQELGGKNSVPSITTYAMWRIVPNFDYYGDYTCGTPEPNEEEDQESELDPIHVAGSASLNWFKKTAAENGLLFARDAVNWLTSSVGDLLIKEKRPPPPRHETRGIFLPHICQLQHWAVLEQCDAGRILAFGSYFEVPKSTTGPSGIRVSRPILNAGGISRALFRTPDPVNLPDIREVIEKIERMTAANSRLFTWTCDIRHWFHQLTIESHLRKYFGIRIGDGSGARFWRWKVLPMGWSHSPRICQCLAWTLILAPRSDGEFDGLARARQALAGAVDPPRYVAIRNVDGAEIGFICVTYDNIGVFSTDRNITEVIRRNIMKNFKDANVVLKEERLCGRKMFIGAAKTDGEIPRNPSGYAGPDYLGIQFAVSAIEGRPRLIWRHVPERTQKWLATLETLKTATAQASLSTRSLAKAVGIAVWHGTATRQPLFQLRHALDVLRRIYQINPHVRWSSEIRISEDEGLELQRLVHEAITNAWTIPPAGDWRNSPHTWLFTDASDKKFGVVVAQNPDLFSEHSGLWDKERAQWHIFLKELAAVVEGLRYLESKNIGTPARISLVVDNSAAAFCIRNWISTNKVAIGMLQDIHERLTNNGWFMETILVPSEHNAADDPSRFKAVTSARVRQGIAAAEEINEGRSRRSQRTYSGHKRIRHGEHVMSEKALDDENEAARETDPWLFDEDDQRLD
jgi:hypothetical protein